MTKAELLQHLRQLIDETGTQKDLAAKLVVSLGLERVVIFRIVGE